MEDRKKKLAEYWADMNQRKGRPAEYNPDSEASDGVSVSGPLIEKATPYAPEYMNEMEREQRLLRKKKLGRLRMPGPKQDTDFTGAMESIPVIGTN